MNNPRQVHKAAQSIADDTLLLIQAMREQVPAVAVARQVAKLAELLALASATEHDERDRKPLVFEKVSDYLEHRDAVLGQKGAA